MHIRASASSVISTPEALKNSVRTRSANLVTKLHAKSTKTTKKRVPAGAQNRPKIDKNRYVDSKVSFCASLGPPRAATGAKIAPQGAKMEPLGLPNGNFGYPKTTKTG